MSNRERWIIYPLLFMALSLAAKDQFIGLGPDRLSLGAVECESLTVGTVDLRRGGRSRSVVITADPEKGGTIIVTGPNEVSVAAMGYDVKDEVGVVETHNRLGEPQIRLTGTDRGGLLWAFSSESDSHWLVGHDGEVKMSGVYVLDEQRRVQAVLQPVSEDKEPNEDPDEKELGPEENAAENALPDETDSTTDDESSSED